MAWYLVSMLRLNDLYLDLKKLEFMEKLFWDLFWTTVFTSPLFRMQMPCSTFCTLPFPRISADLLFLHIIAAWVYNYHYRIIDTLSWKMKTGLILETMNIWCIICMTKIDWDGRWCLHVFDSETCLTDLFDAFGADCLWYLTIYPLYKAVVM